MADVPGYAPLPNYIGQIAEGEQAGTQEGTAIANAADNAVTTATNAGLTRAQTQGQQLNNQLLALKEQWMSSQMTYAQHLLSGMSSGPLNDDGSSSAVRSAEAASLQKADDSGVAPGAAGDPQSPSPSAAPPGITQPGPAPASGAVATPGIAPKGAPLTLADVGLDPGHIDASTQRRFGVFGIMSPQEYQDLNNARVLDATGAAMGMPTQYAAMKAEQIKARIAQQTATAAAGSSEMYDRLTDGIVKAPAGTAWEALDRLNSDMGAKLQAVAKDNNWSPEQLDQVSRLVASETANSMYRYTQRESKTGDDGITRDVKTQQPITGAQQVGVAPNTQFTGAARASAGWADTVEVPTGVPGQTKLMQRYQLPAPGHPNGFANVAEATKSALPPTAVPQAPPIPGATGPTAAQAAPAPGAPNAPAAAAPPLNPIQRVQQRNQQNATAAAGPNAPAAAPAAGAPPAAPGAANAPGAKPAAAIQPGTPPPLQAGPKAQAPYQAAALADKSFDIRPTTNTFGTTASAQQSDYIKGLAPARAATQKQIDADTEAADKQLQFIRAAQDVLEHGKPAVGAYSGLITEASKLLHINLDQVTDTQQLAKYLGNAALQNARATYGARMSQMEVKLQLNELSPSTQMTPKSVNELLSKMGAIATYYQTEGQRWAAYNKDPNKDPGQFLSGWQEKWYPGATMVNVPQPSNASLRTLRARPELAPQFRQRYGYVPE